MPMCLITILSAVPYALGAWSSPCHLCQPGTHSLYVTRCLWGKTKNKDFEFNVPDWDIASLTEDLKCLIEISGFWSMRYTLVSCLILSDATAQNKKNFSIFLWIRGDGLISSLCCCPKFSEVSSQFYQTATRGRLFTAQTNQAATLDFLT